MSTSITIAPTLNFIATSTPPVYFLKASIMAALMAAANISEIGLVALDYM